MSDQMNEPYLLVNGCYLLNIYHIQGECYVRVGRIFHNKWPYITNHAFITKSEWVLSKIEISTEPNEWKIVFLDPLFVAKYSYPFLSSYFGDKSKYYLI